MRRSLSSAGPDVSAFRLAITTMTVEQRKGTKRVQSPESALHPIMRTRKTSHIIRSRAIIRLVNAIDVIIATIKPRVFFDDLSFSVSGAVSAAAVCPSTVQLDGFPEASNVVTSSSFV